MRKETDNNPKRQSKPVPTVSAMFGDGAILEMVYSPTERRTAFTLWRNEEWTVENSIGML